MTKIDIFSGFLGAGKTTLIKKLIKEAYNNEKLVLIENEFGEIGIDGGFLKEAGIEITEMNSGCICCSLVGDFKEALEKVIAQFSPDRILIEPSGVGKLSDVIRAVQNVSNENVILNGFTTVVDANKCKMYMKNFGEFFNDQVQHASSIILSRTDALSEDKLNQTVALLREHNKTATIVTTPWPQIDGSVILSAMEKKNTLEAELLKLKEEHHHHHHHHDDECDCHEHHHDEHCGCHEHAHEHEHEHEHHHDHCEHEHHEHHYDEHGHCSCGHHEHDEHHEHHHEHHEHHEHHHKHEHHHGDECDCGCHEHGHHHEHHHHADDVFASIGKETAKKFSSNEIDSILNAFTESSEYGTILRAKGIVAGVDGKWIHFDYVPGESNVRNGAADIIGRICVIGADIKEDKIAELFGI